MKKLLVILSISLLTVGAFAQKAKFGHVNSNAVFTLMPEKQVASKAVEDYAMTLETQLQSLNKELELKYNDYMEKQETMSPSIKQMKEEEIVNLQQRIQAFQTRAQEDMQAKEIELLEPIYTKIQNAIKEVGEENSFIYIFDESTLLYHSSESVDVTNMVKTKLGIN